MFFVIIRSAQQLFDILSLVSRILELTDSLGRDLTKLNTRAYITVCQVINELVTNEKKRKERNLSRGAFSMPKPLYWCRRGASNVTLLFHVFVYFS